jgi:prepilin-type N-terminal cleavage/methylation domain-containing protein
MQKNTQRGFSLIELLVVINIVAILVGVASMVYSGRTGEARCLEIYKILPQIIRSQGFYMQHYKYYSADHNGLERHGVDLSEVSAFTYSTSPNESSSYSVKAEATAWAPGGWVTYNQRGEPRWSCDGVLIQRHWLPE